MSNAVQFQQQYLVGVAVPTKLATHNEGLAYNPLVPEGI